MRTFNHICALVVCGPTASFSLGQCVPHWEAVGFSPPTSAPVTVTDYLPDASGATAYVGVLQAVTLGGVTSTVFKAQAGAITPLPFNGTSGMAYRLAFIESSAGPLLVSSGYGQSVSSWRNLSVWQNDLLVAPPSGLASSQGYSSGDIAVSRRAPGALYLAGRFNITPSGTRSLLQWSGSAAVPLAADPVGAPWGSRLATRATATGEVVYMTDVNSFGTPLRVLSSAGVWTSISGTMSFRGGSAATYDFPVAWFDDDDGGHLYLAGRFDVLNGSAAQSIARLQGNTLVPLAAGVTGGNSLINDLAVFDDGSGPALYAIGAFSAAGGVSANNIARLRHGAWEAVGSGFVGAHADSLLGLTSRLRVQADASANWLYVMGSFDSADGIASPRVARYGGCVPCPADFNRDGVADLFDYLDFAQSFATGASAADFNRDGVIDFFDYLDFVATFAVGC